MIDLYTKAVLTVIAIALILLVAKQAAPYASAAFGDCGSRVESPCYMEVVP